MLYYFKRLKQGAINLKENICTIPINDLFRPKDGCPICRMEEMLEETYVEYTVGDSMMEPNTRIETNKKGFCHRHFSKMFQVGQKLPNALILETHLQQIIDEVLPKKAGSKADKKALDKISELEQSCYVCDRIQRDVNHLLSTVFVQYQKDEEFVKLYREQPFICLNHYSVIMKKAEGKNGISKKNMAQFHKDTYDLTKNYLTTLKDDITHFCSMFDYRNRGGDFGNSKDAIERSIEYLTKEKP